MMQRRRRRRKRLRLFSVAPTLLKFDVNGVGSLKLSTPIKDLCLNGQSNKTQSQQAYHFFPAQSSNSHRNILLQRLLQSPNSLTISSQPNQRIPRGCVNQDRGCVNQDK
ncbi:hypothetical protein RIF29_13323 [Crotalaria pallida]|uniref:Uncharacterized protein n=1 Tax=Crotalaria pallida TaxID=3830 RepID=A0AAN9P1Y2_CROPI